MMMTSLCLIIFLLINITLWSHHKVAASTSSKPSISSEMRRKFQQSFKSISTKASSAGSCSNAIETLQHGFYSHIQNWLSANLAYLQETDMEKMQKFVDEFEGCVTDFEQSEEKSEVCLTFYTNLCDIVMRECMESLPIVKPE